MNRKIYKSLNCILPAAVMLFLFSCNDFLNREPLSQLSPEIFFTDESQLAAYANNYYVSILPSHLSYYGTYAWDAGTDNQAYLFPDENRYVPGQWRVGESGGDWSFDLIYPLNYFMDKVLPKWEAGEITGDAGNIKHYIGEIYFLRAYEYFAKLQEFGDFPIIKHVLPDELDSLTEASKRYPCNEVARFILSDLDQAISLLKESAPDGQKNRISRYCAYLVKSRVALYEGTWLKYFKGTAFVPNGEGWPGKTKDYNANYQFPAGSIDNEIDYFLGQAMEAAAIVADATPLVENTGLLQQSVSDPVNPYHDMFGDVDLSGYSEVLQWRQYDLGLGLTHGVVIGAQLGNYSNGLTRGIVDSYLMANGLPIYDPASGYAGDDYIADVRKNRDNRLWLFLKEPGQINMLWDSPQNTHGTPVEPVPDITNGSTSYAYTTGYTCRKGNNYNGNQCGNNLSWTGSITFRAAEAYLNYIEACYEKNGSIDNKAGGYWVAIRNRAKVDPDYQRTIGATVMEKEAPNDWGAYSAGKLIDPTLYNIRRERRSEFIDEGLRFMDLTRWRAMDQMINTPYHIEGFKLWGPMQNWYDPSILIYGLDNNASTVSSPSRSVYLRPYEKTSRSLLLDGYKWVMAYYLSPIAIRHFLITSDNNDISTSPMYQNPGWPTVAGSGAIGY